MFHNKILITGAAGFIGKHLSNALNRQGHRVLALSRTGFSADSAIEQHLIDLNDRKKLTPLINQLKPDYVVHLASIKKRSTELSDYRQVYEQNWHPTINLVEACSEAKCLKRFVFIGSCEEYGLQLSPFKEMNREMPVSAYAASKLAITHFLQALARANQFPSIILRPSLVYGPGQAEDMFLPALINALLNQQRFAMTHGEQYRDYLYIDDLIMAIQNALFAEINPGELINVSSGTHLTIKEITLKVTQFIEDSASLLDIGLLAYRTGEAMNYCASNARAKAILGWEPKTSIETGLSHTIKAMQQAIAMKNHACI